MLSSLTDENTHHPPPPTPPHTHQPDVMACSTFPNKFGVWSQPHFSGMTVTCKGHDSAGVKHVPH